MPLEIMAKNTGALQHRETKKESDDCCLPSDCLAQFYRKKEPCSLFQLTPSIPPFVSPKFLSFYSPLLISLLCRHIHQVVWLLIHATFIEISNPLLAKRGGRTKILDLPPPHMMVIVKYVCAKCMHSYVCGDLEMQLAAQWDRDIFM